MKINLLQLMTLATTACLVMAFVTVPQGEPWIVPDKYKNMKNPVTYDKSLATSLWSTHCKSCHGKEGLGDGPKAAQLDTPSGDFSDDEFQAQSDGSLFYKTLEGRDDMPSYKKKIPEEEDMWQLVHYMRGFAE